MWSQCLDRRTLAMLRLPLRPPGTALWYHMFVFYFNYYLQKSFRNVESNFFALVFTCRNALIAQSPTRANFPLSSELIQPRHRSYCISLFFLLFCNSKLKKQTRSMLLTREKYSTIPLSVARFLVLHSNAVGRRHTNCLVCFYTWSYVYANVKYVMAIDVTGAFILLLSQETTRVAGAVGASLLSWQLQLAKQYEMGMSSNFY